MPRLPSGRFVEITPDRARYHAARTGVRIKQNTPHAQLYALVDILVEHPRSILNTGRLMGFSGHTLDDTHWLQKWCPADRKFFMAWTREQSQVRVIEQARRRLLAEASPPREQSFDYPDHLYSYLRQRVEALTLPKATVQQWRNTLQNLCASGVLPEELEWSGIVPFLDNLPPQSCLDKSVIIDAMDFSEIRPRLSHGFVCAKSCNLPFSQVAQKLEAYELQMAGLAVSDKDIGVIRLRSNEPAYKVGVLWPGGRTPTDAASSAWFALGPYGEIIVDGTAQNRNLFDTQDAAVEAARRSALRNGRAHCDLIASANYDYMTLHGGEQYREWLVTLPEYGHTHFTGHYLERNVLVHIRTKVRTSQCGARVLFIEELQSDWHQARASKKAHGAVPRAPYRKDWPALALKLMTMHAMAQNLDGIAWTDGEVHEMRYDKALPPLRRLYDTAMVRFMDDLAKPWGMTVQRGQFATRSPWLHAVRRHDVWRVEGGKGKFSTRTRYTKDEAMRLIERHSKSVTLSLPMMLFNDGMREHIAEHGLPLFGAKTDLSVKG
ncbi:MAG TPA: hypothetical protein VIN57_06675 [Magnetovibrio sp.]